MRYNGNELKQMALDSQGNCTKEGVLSFKEKEGKLWNKTDVLTEKWCRLVDNMFFYFKTKDMNSDPHGVFVLEGSSLRLAENDSMNGCAFILEFDGESRSTYFLARQPSEAQQWVKVLSNASYTQLKLRHEYLRRQQKLHGKEGQCPSNLQEEQCFVPNMLDNISVNSSPLLLSRKKISPKDYKMTLSDVDGTMESKCDKRNNNFWLEKCRILTPDSTIPMLELMISGIDMDITKAIEHKRLLQLHVSSSFSPISQWTPVFQTECIKPSPSPSFLCTASFFHRHLLTPQTRLQFCLCQIKENSTVESLGTASCSICDLLYMDYPVIFPMQNARNIIGKLRINVCREHLSAQITKCSSERKLFSAVLSSDSELAEGIKKKLDVRYGDVSQILNLKSIYCEAISRTYRFPTVSGNYLSIHEIMLETRLSLHIPNLYLKLLIDQETRHIGTLNSISFLAMHLQQLRTKQIDERQNLIKSYQENIKSIVMHSHSGSFFKPSIRKTEKEFEFIPTNLHLQRMRVQHSDFISALSVDSVDEPDTFGPILTAVYDVVTVGAATAHCLKYKQGGLLSLISSSEKGKKSKEHILSTLSSKDSLIEEMVDLSVRIAEVHKETNMIAETLRTLILAAKECHTVPQRISAESAISCLSDKACLLVSLLDNVDLCKSIRQMLHSSVTSSTPGRSLASAMASLVSSNGMEWEELKSSVKTTLANLVKIVHLMLDASEQNLLLDVEPFENDSPIYDDILKSISQLLKQITTVLEIAAQAHALYIMQRTKENSSITYRRDVVFSQALSTCVCGVSTNLLSSIHKRKYLSDVASHGMLVQFESLLSTYGNEMGMLEDHVVGVRDLQSVMFYCELAEAQEGPDLCHLLPTMHGTRNNLSVRLHLDRSAFDLLPEAWKRGEPFKIKPVLFNVGINEEQSLAEKFGKTSLQEYINMDSYARMYSYYQSLTKSMEHPGNSESRVNDCMNRLSVAVHAKKNKNVEILHLASEICVSLNGVRVTSCKSAKDRTAMAVTLEQVQNLTRNHDLSLSMFTSALSCMRSEGTRRENTRKNVGVRKYAFTSVQLMTFPKQYRPPDGTYGKGDT